MKSDFCYSLTRFIPELTKVKGDDYPGKTLYEMVMSIPNYLNQKDITWKLSDDPDFLAMKTVFDNVMKEQAKSNVGMVRK